MFNCAILDIDMPVVVHVKVVDYPVMAQMTFSLVPSSDLEISQFQFIDQVFDVLVAQVQQFPRVQSVRNCPRSHSCTRRIRAWTLSFTRPFFATTDARMVQSAQNCDGPAVEVLRQSG